MSEQSVGLRELRQRASELVRRVEAGEALTVTVNGRIAARLVPPDRARWRRYAEIEELFAGPPEGETFRRDTDALDTGPHDPWEVA